MADRYYKAGWGAAKRIRERRLENPGQALREQYGIRDGGQNPEYTMQRNEYRTGPLAGRSSMKKKLDETDPDGSQRARQGKKLVKRLNQEKENFREGVYRENYMAPDSYDEYQRRAYSFLNKKNKNGGK